MKTIFLRSLALACLAATTAGAQAQSSVNLYGLLDLSFGSTKAPGGLAQTGIDNGKLTTSYFGLRGTEDLGGGLAAVLKLEGFIRADTGESGRFAGDGLFTRNAAVGLSEKSFGTVLLGRNTTPLFVTTLAFNAFGDSYGFSPSIRHYFTSGTVTGDSGWSNSVLYSSPSVAGFKFGAVAATKGNGNGNSNGGNWGLDVGYAAGPLAASAVVQQVKKDGATPVADSRTFQLAGSYDFVVAKVFLQLGEVKNLTVPNTYRISGLGARVPVGPGAVLAQIGRLSPTTGPDCNTVSVGYSYNLSKRSELYAAAMRDKIDNVSAGSSYSVGMRHRF